jgi:hypothetical protein
VAIEGYHAAGPAREQQKTKNESVRYGMVYCCFPCDLLAWLWFVADRKGMILSQVYRAASEDDAKSRVTHTEASDAGDPPYCKEMTAPEGV